jgi:hypothetical protein
MIVCRRGDDDVADREQTLATVRGGHGMAKGMDRKKDSKKKPAKTLMEKRAAKSAKKGR